MRTLLVTFLLLLGLAVPAAADDPILEPFGGPAYYLALGDSLAAGYQPIGDPELDHMTTSGYPEQLWLMARQHYPGLQLVKLACPGETTETIWLDNGRCTYPGGSQMAEALAFIEDHPDQLAFITIDIGFNDFDCTHDPSCVFAGLRNIGQRLPPILAELQAAAPGVPIVGMDIYDPYLTYWLDVDTRPLAAQSVVAIELVNEQLGRVYEAAGIPVADVAGAFDFGLEHWGVMTEMAGFGQVPLALARVCERTWMCHPPPLGPDRHPNVLGFRVMAEAFARELGLEPSDADLNGHP